MNARARRVIADIAAGEYATGSRDFGRGMAYAAWLITVAQDEDDAAAVAAWQAAVDQFRAGVIGGWYHG